MFIGISCTYIDKNIINIYALLILIKNNVYVLIG